MTDKQKAPGTAPESLKSNRTHLDNPDPQSTQGEVNWLNDDRIVLNDQAAIAAYIDEYGNLVITQRDTLGDPEATLIIAPESVKVFARAISSLAGESESPAAERARRYRENKKRDASVTEQRDASRDANVTGRDASVTDLRIVRGSSS